MQSSSADNNRYLYTGREWDEDLGLYHYRARMYDSYSGRFCSRDPVGFSGSLGNLYRYVSASPALKLDPYGLKEPKNIPVIGGAGPYRCIARYTANPCYGFEAWLKSLGPKVETLTKCTKNRGCANRISCDRNSKPGTDGIYRLPMFGPPHILISFREMSSPIYAGRRTVLEELYHALTLCFESEQNSAGSSLKELSEKLDNSGLSSSEKTCALCYANELAAKSCSDPNKNFGSLLNYADGSCGSCAIGQYGGIIDIIQSPVGQLVHDWYMQTNPKGDCSKIDEGCGA